MSRNGQFTVGHGDEVTTVYSPEEYHAFINSLRTFRQGPPEPQIGILRYTDTGMPKTGFDMRGTYYDLELDAIVKLTDTFVACHNKVARIGGKLYLDMGKRRMEEKLKQHFEMKIEEAP